MADDTSIGLMGQAREIWDAGLPPKSVSAFLFSAACVVIVTLARLALGHIAFESSAFAPYYAATLIVSLLCGWRAAFLAATIGGFCAFALFIWPEIGTVGTEATAIVSLCLYGASSIVIVLAAESYRKLLIQVRAQEHYRKLLSDEMAHRIKNTLTVAQTIVWHSMPHDPVARDQLCSRLVALGRTNERLLSAHGSVLFSVLLRSELEHFDISRVMTTGPDFHCNESGTVCLSLIFHELATNSAKYGALSAPGGRISVVWSIDDGQLYIEWREEGVSDLRTPDRKGFGSKLLQTAAAQFRGRVEQRFESDGLKCRLWLQFASLGRITPASGELKPPQKDIQKAGCLPESAAQRAPHRTSIASLGPEEAPTARNSIT